MVHPVSGFLQAAREVAREACWCGEVFALIDLATPYLPEAWVSIDLALEVVRELARCSYPRVVIGVLAGDPRDALKRLPEELRKRVVDPSSLSVYRAYLRAYRKTVPVDVARVRMLVAVTLPRTNPYPPLLGCVPLVATYLTSLGSRWVLYADPRWVDLNLATVFAFSHSESVAVVEASRVMACDGPIHGCLDSFLDAILVGDPLSTDWLISRVAGIELRYLDEAAKLKREAPRVDGVSSLTRVAKLKTHSLSRVLAKGASAKGR